MSDETFYTYEPPAEWHVNAYDALAAQQPPMPEQWPHEQRMGELERIADMHKRAAWRILRANAELRARVAEYLNLLHGFEKVVDQQQALIVEYRNDAEKHDKDMAEATRAIRQATQGLNNYAKRIAELEAQLASTPQMEPDWIPVETLPPMEDFMSRNIIEIRCHGWCEDDGLYMCLTGTATHWRPLPETDGWQLVRPRVQEEG